MTTADTLFASSAIQAASSSCSTLELQARVDRQAEVLARPPGSSRRRSRASPARWGRAGRRASAGEPASIVLVVLLDAVLAGALAVDEAEQMRGQASSRAAAGLRIDALRLGFEGDAEDPLARRSLAGSGRRLGSMPRARMT